ncbi:MAG: hypothetical protein ACKV1O_25450 [Saprospiraceae bacterium]
MNDAKHFRGAFRAIFSRKGRKGLAEDAKPKGATLCGLGVSFAPFAGNFRREPEKWLAIHSKTLVFSQLMPI